MSCRVPLMLQSPRNRTRGGDSPNPSLLAIAPALRSIYCEKYDYINVDIRDHVVISSLHFQALETIVTLEETRAKWA